MVDLVGSNFISTVLIAFSVLAVSCKDTNDSIGIDDGPKNIEEVNVINLYVRHCIDCHGENGDLGLMGAKSLVTSKMTISERIHLITNGSENGKMKPFGLENYGDLNAIEIEALAKHIETLRH